VLLSIATTIKLYEST